MERYRCVTRILQRVSMAAETIGTVDTSATAATGCQELEASVAVRPLGLGCFTKGRPPCSRWDRHSYTNTDSAAGPKSTAPRKLRADGCADVCSNFQRAEFERKATHVCRFGMRHYCLSERPLRSADRHGRERRGGVGQIMAVVQDVAAAWLACNHTTSR